MSDQKNPFQQTAAEYRPTITLGGPGQQAASAAPEAVKDVTTASFAADVIQESRNRPVLVDFWAPWCGPCKQLAPLLEKVVAESAGAVRLVKMNIDEHPAVAGQLGIQSIPAVIAFRDGQPVDGFMGAVPESQIREFLKRLGGDPAANAVELALEDAVAAIGRGEGAAASEILHAILEAEPAHGAAAALLADIEIEAGRLDEAEGLLARFPEDPKEPAGLAGARAKLAVARETASLGDPSQIEARLAADPKDHQARFDLAMIENARGNRDAAADHLLSIMKADRSWNDDGARLQLLKFFEAWGLADPATLSARRKLSSLLFA